MRPERSAGGRAGFLTMNDVFNGMPGGVAGYALLCMRVVSVGWLWAPPPRKGAGDDDDFWRQMGRIVVWGLLLNLLPALMLAAFHSWTPAADWAMWCLVLGVGLIRFCRRNVPHRLNLRIPAMGFAALWLAGLVLIVMPPRSEWLAGGWDPGIYVNNALAISRDAGVGGRPETVYTHLSHEERLLFMRIDGRYHEAFPATPVRMDDGSMPLYFFHLTPMCGALFHRMGGMDLLYRMPGLLAIWGLFPALALFGALGFGARLRWVGLGCMLLSAIWWYHQAIPTSEMLYLFLLLGGVLLYIQSVRDESTHPWGPALVCFAATVNHMNAAVLLGFMLLFASALESAGQMAGRGRRAIGCFAALILAVGWNLLFAEMTILRLEEKDQILRVVLPVLAACAGGALLLARFSVPLRWGESAMRLMGVAGVLAGAVMILAGLGMSTEWTRPWMIRTLGNLPLMGSVLEGFMRIVPFQGAGNIVWAGMGLIWLGKDRSRSRLALRAVTLALGGVLLALLIAPGIAALYPWALRRYVMFLVPFLALTQTFAILRLTENGPFGKDKRSWLAAVVVLAGILHGATVSLSAMRVGDYRGLGAIVRILDDVVQPDDLIVADDPRWGTPLLLAGGREVVNGRLLWRRSDPEDHRAYMAVLQRLQREQDRRILWLTSTERGMEIYPVIVSGHVEPVFEVRYSYFTVNHSSRARFYQQKEHNRVFRYYIWDGEFELP